MCDDKNKKGDKIPISNYYNALSKITEIETNNIDDEKEELYNNEFCFSELYNEYSEEAETALNAYQMNFKDINEHTWLVDTGVSAHITNILKGMKNLRNNYKKIMAGRGEQFIESKIRDEVRYITRIDEEQKIILKNTKCVPKINVKLISLTTVMNQRFELIGSKRKKSIRKDGHK